MEATMKFIILPLAIAALALSSCDRMKKDDHAKADPAAVEQQLRAIETSWNADYNTHNPDKIVGYYADDASLANPGSAIATDAAARRAEIAKFVADPSLKLEFAADSVRVAKSGDLATTRGHYSTQVTDPATKQVRTDIGSYLTVWQKQADGSWKAVEDFITPGVPSVQPATP
jgi:ketosteroid isomerase-like protein